jgi:hypothetical protein
MINKNPIITTNQARTKPEKFNPITGFSNTACFSRFYCLLLLFLSILLVTPGTCLAEGEKHLSINKQDQPEVSELSNIFYIQDAGASFATDRGNLMIGGGLSFRYRKGVDDFEGQSVLFEFEPKISVFVAPSFSIGGTIITRYYKYGDLGASTTWGIGPTLTYYIAGHKKKTVYPYFEGSFILTSNSYIITYSELEFGAMFMLSDAVGLTTSLKYRLDIYYPEGSQAEHINNIIFGVGIRTFIVR